MEERNRTPRRLVAALAVGFALALAAAIGAALVGWSSSEGEGVRVEQSARAPQAASPRGRPPPRVAKGIWISRAELDRLPTAGAGWRRLRAVADAPLGEADVSDRDSAHDLRTLAAALVYARTGRLEYRAKAAEGIADAIGTEGGSTLPLARNLFGYVVAADLIVLRQHDRSLNERFRAWLEEVRAKELDERTLVSTHELRPNNWGTHAGASRAAVAVYLGDWEDLERAAAVFRGWLGDREAYAGFEYGSLWWQADEDNPVGINPRTAIRDGADVDGALPEEMRRGGRLRFPPKRTGYTWEALQGAFAQAYVLHRQGYDAFEWEEQALLRAVQFLERLDRAYGGWWAEGDDSWVPWLANAAYGASFPAGRSESTGKSVDFTDWTLAGHRGELPQVRETPRRP